MRIVLAVVGVALLLVCSACSTLDVQTPGEALRRAREDRLEAAALRKDAVEYAALMERTERARRKCEARLESLRRQQAELEQQIQTMKSEKESLQGSKVQLQAQDKAIEVYSGRKLAVEANIDNERDQLAVLQRQMEEQRNLHDSMLRRADQKELEARELMNQAALLPAK